MPDYEKMYFSLFAKVADAVELLIKAEREGEESYIGDDDRIEETPPVHEESPLS